MALADFESLGRSVLIALIGLLPAALRAQDDPNARPLCKDTPPGTTCPSFTCACSNDAFAVVFEPGRASTLELDGFEPGIRVETSVMLHARTEGIQGWSLGVGHNPSLLKLELATFEGTDAAAIFSGGFQVTRPTCEGCESAGYISATVLSLRDNLVLPTGKHSVVKATYLLLPEGASASEGGLLIEPVDGLAGGGQPVSIVITANGESTRPRTIVFGRIFWPPEDRAFHRGDPTGDGRVTIGDAVSIILFLFLLGPSPTCLEAGDTDDSNRLDTTDAIIILRWLFLGDTGPAPPGPPPAPCGPDPDTGEPLGCDAYGAC